MSNYEVRISDTFTHSLAKLTSDEQKSTKTTAFDLQINPSNPGMQFHKIEKSKDKHFWSVRINRDLRLILHKSSSSILLCYVDHHDRAYAWAERRKIEVHPKTGAAQLVEIRETVQEVFVPYHVPTSSTSTKDVAKPKFLFSGVSSDELLSYGVPSDWIAEVQIATEDSLLAIAGHLPSEAAEALLELATGGKPNRPKPPGTASINPFDHPDAQRRFKLIASSDELAQALDFPWDKWTVFLHPEQRSFVEKDFGGPARVSGSAGTGKTIVALHRAYNLAIKNRDCRVLLTTFSDSLANALRSNLNKLIARQPMLGEQIEVLALPTMIKRLFERQFGKTVFASESQIKKIISQEKCKSEVNKFSTHFLWKEWEQIVDAWQIRAWEQYKVVPRLGRKTRLNEDGRKVLWSLFETVREELTKLGLITESDACQQLEAKLRGSNESPYDFAVVDEAQDITVPQLRMLGAILAEKPNGLFFSGDLGQRVFQQPFSWSALGVDIRGRSKTLKINYRTSQEIRRQADKLLDPQFTDVDGVTEDRRGTISVFSGPEPLVRRFSSVDEECVQLAKWLQGQLASGVAETEICIIVRSIDEIPRALEAVLKAGCKASRLDEQQSAAGKCIAIATMHIAKGLEFRSVAVIACDDEVIPLQSRIESVGDDADLHEVYATERQLLYVACTRARDCLWVSGVEPTSEFMDDFEHA